MIERIAIAVVLFVSACASDLQPSDDENTAAVEVGVDVEPLTTCEFTSWHAASPYLQQKIPAPYSSCGITGTFYNDTPNTLVFQFGAPCPVGSNMVQANWTTYGNQQSTYVWRYFSTTFYAGHILQCNCHENTGPTTCSWIS